MLNFIVKPAQIYTFVFGTVEPWQIYLRAQFLEEREMRCPVCFFADQYLVLNCGYFCHRLTSIQKVKVVPPWSVQRRRPMGSAARSLSPPYCLDPFPILCDCSISLFRSFTTLVHFLLGPCSGRMTLLLGQRLPREPQYCTPKIHSLLLGTCCKRWEDFLERRIRRIKFFRRESFRKKAYFTIC